MACSREIGGLPLLSEPLTSPFHDKQRDQTLSSHNPEHYLRLTFIWPRRECRVLKNEVAQKERLELLNNHLVKERNRGCVFL